MAQAVQACCKIGGNGVRNQCVFFLTKRKKTSGPCPCGFEPSSIGAVLHIPNADHILCWQQQCFGKYVVGCCGFIDEDKEDDAERGRWEGEAGTEHIQASSVH